MKKPVFLIVGHFSASNRGCEAIVRSTLSIFEGVFSDFHMHVVHMANDGWDARSRIAESKNVTLSLWARRTWTSRLRGAARRLRLIPELDDRDWVFEQIDCARNGANIVMAVGGDNYSEDYGAVRTHFSFLEWALERGLPAVIWGASIGPFRDETNLTLAREILPRIDLVCIRETVSQRYLESIGVTRNVVLVSDPAFTLKPEPPACEELNRIRSVCGGGPVLGLNVSGGLWRYLSFDRKDYVESCRRVADWFVGEVGGSVILVPHVIRYSNPQLCDYSACQQVFSLLKNKERCVIASPDNDCCQVKTIIGSCDAFIGARTHPTIAALSLRVPTLAIAYSNKAWGILTDIMGDDSTVIDGKSFATEFRLDMVRDFWNRRGAIRQHLDAVMPAYIKRAHAAEEKLKEVVARI